MSIGNIDNIMVHCSTAIIGMYLYGAYCVIFRIASLLACLQFRISTILEFANFILYVIICLSRWSMIPLWAQVSLQYIDYAICKTKNCWHWFPWWGTVCGMYCLGWPGHNYFLYAWLSQRDTQITQDGRSKIIGSPWMLIFGMVQRAYRFCFHL
jgi:hypothetical protein